MLHVRKTDPEMPRDRAEVKLEPKLEFENHSIVLGLSDDYILVYILPSLSVTAGNSKDHGVLALLRVCW